MKTLETARLRLRPRTLDDLDAIVAMDSDEEVRRFIVRHAMGLVGDLPKLIRGERP